MKKLTIAVFLSLLLCGVMVVAQNAAEVDEMTDKFIRIHIIANSDSDADQALKLDVRDAVLKASEDFLTDCKSKGEAMTAIRENLQTIQSAAEEEMRRQGSDYPLVCTLAREMFDTRVYDDFTLPAGSYDSLTVRIGNSEGKNWWCVCYPQLCIGTAIKLDDASVLTEGEIKIVKEPEKVRFKLWCFEIVRKILNH